MTNLLLLDDSSEESDTSIQGLEENEGSSSSSEPLEVPIKRQKIVPQDPIGKDDRAGAGDKKNAGICHLILMINFIILFMSRVL